MEDSDMKAIREIANGMEYVASEAINNAPYDVTRNARITKVYYDWEDAIKYTSAYDITCDGKPYHINKERGKGIIAEKNDIVKLHIPCNNMNNMYLSYAHDAEDVIIKYEIDALHPSENAWYITYLTENNSGVKIMDMYCTRYTTFPATTKQFSSCILDVPISLYGIEQYTKSFLVTAEDGVLASVKEVVSNPASSVSIKLYNENPDTINPVVKVCKMHIHGVIIPYIYVP